MPINGTSVNYSGRTKDVNIAGAVKGDKQGRQPMTLTFGRISSYCSGVQKLVQRYAIALLTRSGSQSRFEDFGTDLLDGLNGGRLSSRQEFLHVFNLASWAVIKEFKEYQAENPDLPLDEQINTATLESYDITGDTITVHVTITTLAGSSVTFITPLPIQ